MLVPGSRLRLGSGELNGKHTISIHLHSLRLQPNLPFPPNTNNRFEMFSLALEKEPLWPYYLVFG